MDIPLTYAPCLLSIKNLNVINKNEGVLFSYRIQIKILLISSFILLVKEKMAYKVIVWCVKKGTEDKKPKKNYMSFLKKIWKYLHMY